MADRLVQTLIAILKMASDQTDSGLSKTALVKYAYLLDTFEAEETKTTWTKADWRFVHFGPFAGAVADAITHLPGAGIRTIRGEDVGADQDFTQYRFDRARPAPSLVDLGVSRGAALQMTMVMKRFGNRLPEILNHVYFHTAPMQDAKPSQVLDFSASVPIDRSSFGPLPLQPLSKAKVKRGKELLRAAVKAKAARSTKNPYWAPYDETYYRAVAELEDAAEALSEGVEGRALIEIGR